MFATQTTLNIFSVQGDSLNADEQVHEQALTEIEKRTRVTTHLNL